MDWIDQYQIIRRFVILWLLALTTHVMLWTLEFAWWSARSGAEVAGVIATIWAPMAALQGFVMSVYTKGRGE